MGGMTGSAAMLRIASKKNLINAKLEVHDTY